MRAKSRKNMIEDDGGRRSILDTNCRPTLFFTVTKLLVVQSVINYSCVTNTSDFKKKKDSYFEANKTCSKTESGANSFFTR